MLKEDKGITLIALTVTIIVLLIIAGIAIGGGNESIKMSKSNKLIAELDIVQHACLERYAEYNLTKNEELLVGVEITDYNTIKNMAEARKHTLPEIQDGKFYELDPEDSETMESLGLSQIEDTYVVNYTKGIVMNKTTKETPLGTPLYKEAD